MLLIGPNMKEVNKIKIELNKEFDIKDLEHVRRILGMEINRDGSNSCLLMHHALKLLNFFDMFDYKPAFVPLENH